MDLLSVSDNGFKVVPRRAHRDPVKRKARARTAKVKPKKAKPTLGMRSVRGSQVLQVLLDNKVYHVEDFNGRRRQLSEILMDIRQQGHVLRCVKENGFAIRYELIGH